MDAGLARSQQDFILSSSDGLQNPTGMIPELETGVNTEHSVQNHKTKTTKQNKNSNFLKVKKL